jgi:type I restriction enzyme, R subunit
MTPELKARVSIDALLVAAYWHVCNVAEVNIQPAQALGQATFAVTLTEPTQQLGLRL